MITVVHFFITLCCVEALCMLYYLGKGERAVVYKPWQHGLTLAINIWLALWAYSTLPGAL
jgi:hypothetical protein